jgi:putative resolvase
VSHGNRVSRQSACRWFPADVLAVPARQSATGRILVEEPSAGRAGAALCARVSSADQRGDQDCQVARLVERSTGIGRAPTTVVPEVGPGLNGHRTKLLGLLDDRGATTIMVEHRDRLARFGGQVRDGPTRASRRTGDAPGADRGGRAGAQAGEAP